MSRLESQRNQNLNKKIFLYILVIIALIYFIITVGVKLLINTVLFFTNFKSKDTVNNTEQQNSDLFLPPEVNDLPIATNEAKIIISGKTIKGKQLEIIVNDESQVKKNTDSDTFEETLDLKKGENEIYLTLTDKSKNIQKTTTTYKVTYKSEKPKLDISSPKDQEKFSKDEINISGETEKDNNVRINDLPGIVFADGKFSYSVKLKEGENKVKVEAIDIAGTIEKKELTVFYQKE